MTTTVGLERSYRRLTRLFPRPYRDAREDEIVSVLLEAAAPGQSRATVMESVDLLASAAKSWLLYAIGPNRSSRLVTAGVLAVMLPATFLYGAGMSFRVITSLPVGAVAGYLRHDQSWAAWLAWTAVTVLLLRRMTRSARAMALIATLLYLGSMSYTLWRLGPNPFVHSAAWLLAQVVSCGLLLSPRVVLRGYSWCPGDGSSGSASLRSPSASPTTDGGRLARVWPRCGWRPWSSSCWQLCCCAPPRAGRSYP